MISFIHASYVGGIVIGVGVRTPNVPLIHLKK